jgi:hypothetical protein
MWFFSIREREHRTHSEEREHRTHSEHRICCHHGKALLGSCIKHCKIKRSDFYLILKNDYLK